MSEKNDQSWFNPKILRTNLITASLYVTAFEILKDCIIGNIRDFFTNGYNNGEWIISEKYNSEVLSKNKSVLHASLNWLKMKCVIDDSDINVFMNVKDIRNKIVHEMPMFMQKSTLLELTEPLEKIIFLINKIENWWIEEVEIPTSPDFDDIDESEINYESIVPGNILIIKLMRDISLGFEDDSN